MVPQVKTYFYIFSRRAFYSRMSSRGPLSPDPNEDGFGVGGYGVTGSKPPNSLKLGSQSAPVLLITANVGSIFEEATLLIPQWIDQAYRHTQY